MNNYSKLLLWLFFPIFLKVVFIILFVGSEHLSIPDLFEDLLFLSIIFILSCTKRINNSRWINAFLITSYILYFILETTSFLAVTANFSSSYIYLLIESSKGELVEFFNAYINWKIGVFVLISLYIIYFLYTIPRIKADFKFNIAIIYTILIVVFLKFTGLIENNAYHNIVRGVYGYYDLQNNFTNNALVNNEDVSILSDNDILVLVLGESTTRSHMQLYGYTRNTNPLLSKLKDELYIYNDVISTDVITTKVVPKLLTSIDNNVNNENNLITNIIDVFKIKNIKTNWLSNQRPIGYYDNRISKIASKVDNLKFYNHQDEVKTTSYDEVVLSDFKKNINYDKKQLIIIRLIGTHFDYNKRYPKSFNRFKESNSTKQTTINHYDNAILYNDYVVHALIESLKTINKKSALIYLSDHGENVYDQGDFFGRTEENPTNNMFEIPFILWTSKTFRYPKDFEYKPNRKFMTDHLYESIGHIFGVEHKNMDFSKSIFSKTFKERKRIVVNKINYDSMTNEKN